MKVGDKYFEFFNGELVEFDVLEHVKCHTESDIFDFWTKKIDHVDNLSEKYVASNKYGRFDIYVKNGQWTKHGSNFIYWESIDDYYNSEVYKVHSEKLNEALPNAKFKVGDIIYVKVNNEKFEFTKGRVTRIDISDFDWKLMYYYDVICASNSSSESNGCFHETEKLKPQYFPYTEEEFLNELKNTL